MRKTVSLLIGAAELVPAVGPARGVETSRFVFTVDHLTSTDEQCGFRPWPARASGG